MVSVQEEGLIARESELAKGRKSLAHEITVHYCEAAAAEVRVPLSRVSFVPGNRRWAVTGGAIGAIQSCSLRWHHGLSHLHVSPA